MSSRYTPHMATPIRGLQGIPVGKAGERGQLGKPAPPERRKLLDEVNGHIEDIYNSLTCSYNGWLRSSSKLMNCVRK